MVTNKNKTALVIGHPGHELRVFRWLEIAKPDVFIITDGSGRSGDSRLASTSRLLPQTGCKEGTFYGDLSDAAAYAAILNHEFEVFIVLARKLAEHLIAREITCVAGDAWEGYNPVHDTCRAIINTAVEIAARANHRVLNLSFPLIGPPEACPNGNCDDAVHPELDDAAFARKLAAARAYSELESEVNEAISQNQIEAFRIECLRPVAAGPANTELNEKPYYELYGERKVASGHYSQVIRYREHFVPLAAALWQTAVRRN
ncbi:MAG TPA: hypothetical protein VLL54_15660 [Pyrinomonadaceae bacterium]|nr:hypothetical protein [Pyrinomonadaceae bacterium]